MRNSNYMLENTFGGWQRTVLDWLSPVRPHAPHPSAWPLRGAAPGLSGRPFWSRSQLSNHGDSTSGRIRRTWPMARAPLYRASVPNLSTYRKTRSEKESQGGREGELFDSRWTLLIWYKDSNNIIGELLKQWRFSFHIMCGQRAVKWVPFYCFLLFLPVV